MKTMANLKPKSVNKKRTESGFKSHHYERILKMI